MGQQDLRGSLDRRRTKDVGKEKYHQSVSKTNVSALADTLKPGGFSNRIFSRAAGSHQRASQDQRRARNWKAKSDRKLSTAGKGDWRLERALALR